MPAVDHHGSGLFIGAVEEALARHSKPRIFNTDQGSQLTSVDFTAVLKKAEISMAGKGAWRDNIERLWRSSNTRRSISTPTNRARGPRWHRPLSDLLQLSTPHSFALSISQRFDARSGAGCWVLSWP